MNCYKCKNCAVELCGMNNPSDGVMICPNCGEALE